MATTLRELKHLYEEGRNISEYLREQEHLDRNTAEVIEIAYELQTGSYIKSMADEEFAARKAQYSAEIARVVSLLCSPSAILEAGVGEATTLAGVLDHFAADVESYGFDLSWSRVAYGREWLRQRGHGRTILCTGNLFDIPFATDSIDVVYTSHSIEPNGGNEAEILKELYRVARRYLVLLEPGYELASPAARSRMEAHGYCRNLVGTAQELGCDVLEHRLFPFSANEMNPTALTIIRKKETDSSSPFVLACPRTKQRLEKRGEVLFSPEALVIYPVVAGIPCLRVENGILASRFNEVEGFA